MTQSDDKQRGANIREASKLRATLGSEPSSGYAFHDQVRVDRVERTRAPRAPAGVPQAASHAPQERGFAQTLMGGVTLQDALSNRALQIEPTPENDEGRASGLGWPSVPQELQGSADDARERPVAQRPQPPPLPVGASPTASAQKVSSNPPAGGAIWQAMPSVRALAQAPETTETRSVPPPQPGPARLLTTDPPRHSQPAGYRPSAAELSADYRSAYRDARLLKYEGLVERNAWDQLHEEISREQNLSPELRLLAIVAQRETLKGDQKQVAARLTQDAIAAVAQLLQVPLASPTALVIGKRLLRKNPGWTNKQQPTASLSVGVLLGGIAAGAGVGWLVTTLLF